MQEQKTLVLGADVSKGYADFVAVCEDGTPEGKHFKLPDTAEGHRDLRQRLLEWHRKAGYGRIVLVAESTGGYENNWLRTPRHAEVAGFCEGCRINPKIIHHEYQVQRRGSVTDKVSAATIAGYAAKNIDRLRPLSAKDEELAAARGLIRQINQLEKAATVHKNMLEKLLYIYLPSLLALKSEGWAKYFLGIILEYGTKDSIQRAAGRGFRKVARVPSGFAEKVAEALKDGTGPEVTPALAVADMQSHAREILHLEAAKANMEKLLRSAAPVDTEHVKLLCSIKGMGEDTAISLLCHIGDVSRFESASQMAAFFGVVPRVKQSGDNPGKAHMSKQGNAIVRKELYLLAFRTLSTEPYLRALYETSRQKGMCKDAALGVLMNKLARMVYGILKNGTKFDSGIDRLNQTKPTRDSDKAAQKPQPQETSEQLEQILRAPISKIKRKKITKDYAPQAANTAENAGSS